MGDKPDFNGKWLFHSQENFDAFMSEMGAPWLVRKAIQFDKPTCTIEQDGDDFNMKLVTKITTMEDKFTVGIDFEQKNPNGTVYVVTPSWEGDKLIWEVVPEKGSSGKAQRHVRYIDADMLIFELCCGDAKAKRIFKRETKA